MKNLAGGLLAALIVPLLAGCVSAPPTERIQSTVLCSNQTCNRIDATNSERSLQAIKKFLYDGLSREFALCETSGHNAPCSADDLGMFVMGGPIPGRGALKAASFLSVTDGVDPNSLKLRIELRESFIGTPLICSHADGTLNLHPGGKLILEFAPHYCNWALIGNVFTSFSVAIDRIDLSTRKVTGYYSLATTGTGNGAGSGYTAFRVPDNRLEFDSLKELDALLKAKTASHLVDAGRPPGDLPADIAGLPKVALVIGNSQYRMAPLSNPRNDAEAIEGVLKKLGFRTTTLVDASYDLMEGGLREFMEHAKSSSVALVYYAGHGVEVNGRNYLVGTDVDMASASHVLGPVHSSRFVFTFWNLDVSNGSTNVERRAMVAN